MVRSGLLRSLVFGFTHCLWVPLPCSTSSIIFRAPIFRATLFLPLLHLYLDLVHAGGVMCCHLPHQLVLEHLVAGGNRRSARGLDDRPVRRDPA